MGWKQYFKVVKFLHGEHYTSLHPPGQAAHADAGPDMPNLTLTDLYF